MKRLSKRAIAVVTALSAVASVLPVVTAAPSVEGKIPVISYTFDGNDTHSYSLMNGAALEERDEVNGKAVKLTQSSSQYVKLADNLTAGLTGDFTISVDVNPASETWWTRVFDLAKGDATSADFKNIFLSNNAWTPKFDTNAGNTIQTTTDESADYFNLNEWNHAAIVRSGNTAKMYINGELRATNTNFTLDLDYTGESDCNYLGKSAYSADAYYDGMIDNFQIYNSALTEDEIGILADKTDRNDALIAQHNRYFIETKFMDENGKKIFAAAPGQTVTAEIEITNYKLIDTEFQAVIAINSSSGESTESISYEEELGAVRVASGETAIYTTTIDSSTVPIYGDISVFLIDKNTGENLNAGSIPVGADVQFPTGKVYENVNDDPTYGAHDPTIFRDPVSKKYYAYSSHNLIFESDDLVNWVKKDYNGTITVPEKAKTFLETNYSNTTANGTYWAPDLLYVEGDEYPYWFYLSVSCGLGGRNSVISLVKAKSPGLWDGEYLDCGVVLASVEATGYKTNAIDANIYKENGKVYFIWGSFWEGIHGAQLNADGTIAGIDYTSDATILSSSKNFGKKLFETPNGVMGPEGPFTFKNVNDGYTYMLTSYGWLGSNYNARMARTDVAMDEVLASNSDRRFVDANGNRVGVTYLEQSDRSEPWGYKLIGSYNLGSTTYYGNAHNSVLHDDDGNWYYVQHSRKIIDATAYLQVRKMLWTSSGWPVVSPLVYEGEKVQTIPQQMLCGTWNLCSVGHTIMDGCTKVDQAEAYRGADAPVMSSEVVLLSDGTIGGEKGTWEFDGDYTVTLKFTADGDEDKYEFYKAGDTMEMFVLAGFDEDENGGEKALVMTGVDNNYKTQFAKKINQCAAYLESLPAEATEAVKITKSENGNPIAGFDEKGAITYGGDPSVLVDGDTVYLYVGHDVSTNDSYNIPEYLCYSSKDLVNWEYHGSVFKVNKSTVSWAGGSDSAWAGQVMKYNDKYYLYYCTWANSTYGGYQCIGVATSDSPTGPFTNVSVTPLINGQTMTTENTSTWNDIDPTLWIEKDADGNDRIYMAWGNSIAYTCELNPDMVSVKDVSGDGKITNADIKTVTFNNLEGTYTEAPSLYRRMDENGNYTGKYYMFFAKDWREQWAYATTDDVMSGSWDYENLMMSANATSNTSHGMVFDFNGKTYFIYHNGALPGGSGYRRVANIQEVVFNEDGTIDTMEELSTGISGTATMITTYDGLYLGHDAFVNPLSDASYPLERVVRVGEQDGTNTEWEIVQGKASAIDTSYVSLQAYNKPGLYIKADGTEVVLTQDYDNTAASAMTFITRKALNGNEAMISFESLTETGMYLTYVGNKLMLTNGSAADNASFTVADVEISQPDPTPIPTPEPTPEPRKVIDFNTETPEVIRYLLASTQTSYIDIDGIAVHIGVRGSGADYSTGAAIESGSGVDGSQALKLMNGKFTSSNRGPRVEITTPTVPEGGSVELTMQVKADSANGLFVGNTTTEQGATSANITADGSTWNTVKVVIERTDSGYTRTLSTNGTQIFTDNAAMFPVLWGSANNNSGNLYIDDIVVETITPEDDTVPKLSVKYGSGVAAIIKSENAPENAVIYAVAYDDNGRLEQVESFDAAQGKSILFMPDKVFLWNSNGQPLDVWMAE